MLSTRGVILTRSHHARLPTGSRAAYVCARAASRFNDPYATLGLEPGASKQEVKKAYREMAKRYHPDVSKGTTEVQFLSISEAYAQLIAGKQSSNDDGTPRPHNSEAFHDWYWSFRLRRTWEAKRKAAAAAATPTVDASEPGPPSAEEASSSAAGSTPPIQSAECVRSQLAGLRHRAAIRKHRPSPASPACDSPSSPECQELSEWEEEVEEEEVPVVAAGPSDSADPSSSLGRASAAAPAPPRRPFVVTSEARDEVKSQLQGMRRKAVLKRQFQDA